VLDDCKFDKMTPEESIALIKANLAEVLHPEIIEDVVLKEKRPLRVYWGTATTGKPYVGRVVDQRGSSTRLC
jgi:tyrosyl-tRNA synthetase